MAFSFPKIYPILDSSVIPATGRADFLGRLGGSLADAGVTLLEYRNKTGSQAELFADAAILRAAMPAGQTKLILDDRVDLIEQIGFDGVHVDAGDATPAEARKLLGPDRIIGTFGGGGAGMVPGILETPANYFSIGVVFPTRTKQVSSPPIGMDGVRRLRAERAPVRCWWRLEASRWPPRQPHSRRELRLWPSRERCFASLTRQRSFASGLTNCVEPGS